MEIIDTCLVAESNKTWLKHHVCSASTIYSVNYSSKTNIDQQENSNRFYSGNALSCRFLRESHGSRNRGKNIQTNTHCMANHWILPILFPEITFGPLRPLACKAMQSFLEYGEIYGHVSFKKHHNKSRHMSCFILGVIHRTSTLPWNRLRGPKKVQNLI